MPLRRRVGAAWVVFRAVACCIAILALAAHVGSRYYRALLTCGTAFSLYAFDGQCTMTIAWEDSWGAATDIGLPALRVRSAQGWYFEWWHRDLMYDNTCAQLEFPVWWLGVPWALLAIACSAYIRYRRRRARPGHCAGCGYNLTGNESGICPECGRSVGPLATAGPAPARSTERPPDRADS